MKFAGLATLLATASADMYFQFPGGSNNRLDETQRNVRNDNRLFDSQNNNRFGHNLPKPKNYHFFTGSEIDLQWTVQHSCGPDSNVNCEIILQYACEDTLRDGSSTETIPDTSSQCKNNNCDTDTEFGMHENFESYQYCSLRERNHRLFPADRRIRGENARFTRQEENGQRFGYECNEERDYYPYWAPTIWKDIVVFTDNTTRCDYYKTESENVKSKFFCKVPKSFLDEKYDPKSREAFIPLNETACVESGFTWEESPAHGIPAPECTEAPYQRDNHHGNGEGRNFIGYKWTVPEDLIHEQCTFRVRYNISSSDYDGWQTSIDHKIRDDPRCMCRNNYGVDMWSVYGFSGAEGKARGYRHINDNLVKIFPEIDLRLRVPYNTDQLGRVFEDRTHMVSFRESSSKLKKDLKKGGRLINLNVRGKIGNYVEVYPAFEYDFVPSRVEAKVGDWVHVQWAGASTNNPHNDGSQVDRNGWTVRAAQGRDVNNLVEIDEYGAVRPVEDLVEISRIFGLNASDTEKLALDGIFGPELDDLPDPEGKCYVDTGDRDLSGHVVNIPRKAEGGSIAWCKETCKNEGFYYAGVQYSFQCFCGNEFGKHGEGDKCNRKCQDDSGENCGGVWRQNIYLTGVDTDAVSLRATALGDKDSGYFDLGPRKLKNVGKWMFMSTQNNRFGVRSQKGKVIVKN